MSLTTEQNSRQVDELLPQERFGLTAFRFQKVIHGFIERSAKRSIRTYFQVVVFVRDRTEWKENGLQGRLMVLTLMQQDEEQHSLCSLMASIELSKSIFRSTHPAYQLVQISMDMVLRFILTTVTCHHSGPAHWSKYMQTVKATIKWMPKDQGGRSKPPLGTGVPAYSAEIRFAEEPWPPVDTSWSLVIEKRESESSEYHWIADVKYKMENAPHDSLRPGRPFELYEGNKCVATGTIMGD